MPPRASQPLPQHEAHGSSGGFLAALTLLLVAYTNLSLAGLLFLSAFLMWGSAAIRPEQQRSKRLWAAVSGLSALGLLCQLGIQAAFLLGAPGLRAVVPFLRVLGFPRADSLADALLALVPLLLALLASAAQVQAARETDQQQQAQRSEGTELQPMARQRAWQQRQLGAQSWAAGRGAGAGVAAALVAAAIAQPSVLAAPYVLVAAGAVWRWSGRGGGWGRRGSRGGAWRALLQSYTAAYLVLLYLWQALLHGWALLQPLARVLGLFTLDLDEAQGRGWARLLPGLVQLAALLALHLALGSQAAAAGGGENPPPPRRSAGGAADGWDASGERSPLLTSPPSQQAQAAASALAPGPLRAEGWGQLLWLLLLEAVEALCSRPAVVATLMAGTAMLRPSLLGGCLLLAGLSALLGSWAGAALRCLRRPLASLLLAWLLACYGATVAGRVLDVPPLVDAVGIHAFGAGAWLPLLAMLATAAAVAGPCTALRAGGSPLSSSNLLLLQIQQQQQQRQQMPQSLQSLLVRVGSLRHGSSSPPAGSAAGRSGACSPTAGASGAGLPSVAELDSPSAAAAPWLVAWSLLLRLLFYCGFLAVPAVLFVVGAVQYDVLHSLYLAGLLTWLAARTLQLRPSLTAAVLDGSSHVVLRLFASLHLAALYAAYVGGLPGFDAVLQPPDRQQLLSLVGVWQPSVTAGMLPVLGLLLLATLHSHVGAAVRCEARGEHYCSSVEGVATWHPAAVVHAGRLAIPYGPAAIVVLGYSLLLLDCDIALLGLAYLLLLAALLLHQPPHGWWREPASTRMTAGAAAGGMQSPRALGSSLLPAAMRGLVERLPGIRRVWLDTPSRRWLSLLLLAAYATCDFLAQAALPAVAAAAEAGLPSLPDGVLAFLKSVAGLDPEAAGLQLALRLLRPLLLLAAIAAYRCCYCLGTLHKQLQLQAMSEAARHARSLRSQLGWKALGKRLLILHGSKLVALAAFAAAMQYEGAVGWVLTAGVVALAPLLGAPRPGTTSRQPLLRAGLQGAGAVAGLWMVAQYALCVPWLQDLLLQLSPSAMDWAEWAGLLLPAPPEPGGGSGAAQLERLLRVKCLLLVAVAVKLRAFRWQSKLPEEVKLAGGCGAPCCLFWPQSPGWEPPALDGGLNPAALGMLGMSLLESLQRAATALLSRAQHTTQQALRAIDWPAGQSGPDPGPSSPGAQPGTRVWQPAGPGWAGARDGSGSDAHAAAAAGKGLEPWRLLRFAAQEWLERVWQDWNLDICMFLLLLAAFAAANALSLCYMAAIAAGMALPRGKQQCVWRWLVLPVLALLLLLQYSVLLGPPPGWERWMPPLPHLAPDLQAWLGLTSVDRAALWLLYVSFGACVLQAHYASWARCAAQQARRRAAEAPSTPSHSRAGSFDGIESPQAQVRAPLLGPSARTSLAGGPQEEAHSAGHTTLRVTVATPDPAPCNGDQPEGSSLLWHPLELGAQKQWGWHDWARYLVYRHYLDLLLVCVVALCTAENDIVHAGYLALALAFFRSRIALRSRRNGLFWWLPLFNFLVMLLTLAYQAPLQLLLPPRRPDPASRACSWAHILGLFRLDPGESLLSLGYRGALADVVLWALIRLQSHIFASSTFDRVVAVVREEEAEEKRQLEEQVAAWKRRQAEAAVEESRQRAARRQRVERLKAAAAGSFAAGVDTVQQLYAFLVPQHRQQLPQPGTGLPTEPAQPGKPQRSEAAVPPSPSTAGLTDYERELLAADAELLAERQQAPGSEARPAAAGTAADAAAAAVSATAGQARHFGARLWAWLRQSLRRPDRDSYACYALFCLAFLADCSLLPLALPLSAFAYALVSVRPSGAYWQGVLVYCEALIVVAYAFRVPQQLRCDFVTAQVQYSAEVLGIHGSPLRSLPIFLVYLATLRHHYSLATRHAARQAAAAADAAGPADLEAGAAAPSGGAAGGRAALRRAGSGQYLGETLGSTVSGVLQRVGMAFLRGSTSVWEFLLRCCTVSERPPHFVMVRVAAPAAAGAANSLQRGQQLQEQLQQILDGCRRTDIAAARERQERQRAHVLGSVGATERGGASSHASLADSPLTFEAGAAAASQPAGAGGGGGAAGAGPSQQPLSLTQSGDEMGGEGSRPLAHPDLSTVGPLQLSFVSFVEAPVGAGPAQPPPSLELGAGHDRDKQAAAQVSASAGTSGGDAAGSDGRKVSTALFEVVAVRSTPENSSGWCSVAGWPLRSLNPARHAASTLLRFQRAARGLPLVRQQDSPPSPAGHLDVLAAEHHSRQPQDWYAATTALDFVAWCYVALQYNAVVASARSLSEITSEHVVPLDYLLTILLLFLLLVADRVAYSIGSPLGKALLHLGEMAAYFWYCLLLFWSPLTSTAARNHLRLLLALKCGAFALGAAQLRCGYPPRADASNGMGRHTFWFMRRVSTPRAIAFNAFLALPFVYELRQLLDYATTPSTLTLMDWLKLEEINYSLYLVTWNRKLRAAKRFGERQPRYVKFLQGTLLFAGLLLLLWVPLLLFSSGAPTYTAPTVVAFTANASLAVTTPPPPQNPSALPGSYPARAAARHAAAQARAAERQLGWDEDAGDDAASAADYPLFDGGRRRQRAQWLPDSTPMPDELAAYSPQQFQLLCTSPDADRFWDVTPPAQQELLAALQAAGNDSASGTGVSLALGWDVQRNLPLPSDHGGPLCQGALSVPLAPGTLRQLAAVLSGGAPSARLLRWGPGAGGSTGGGRGSEGDEEGGLAALYPLAWLMRGDLCSSRPLRPGDLGGGGAGEGGTGWAARWVACNASLLPQPDAWEGSAQPIGAGGAAAAAPLHQQRRLSAHSEPFLGGGATPAAWWRLDCWEVNASGAPLEPPAGQEGQGEAECGQQYGGPQLVAVLERVQGGIIGQTLSKYGIAGLYTIVVLSIGRFLRLSLSNTRARIPFEDLPNTRRLVGLCQDLYIARAEGELGLEEQLYWSLINVYRLPEVMFELTRKQQ